MSLKPPRFWQETGGGNLARTLLSPLGHLYDAEVQRRLKRGGAVMPRPVICIGNLTMGGVGKTPFARMLGQALLERGHKPHVVSRGYGGTVEGPQRILPHHTAAEVGDEPLLLARDLPVWVSRDRVRGAKAAIGSGADLILLDDGFQNPSLKKALSFVLLDAKAPFGNGAVFPAGPLREKPEHGFRRAGAVVLIGDGEPELGPDAEKLPRFKARFQLDARDIPEGPLLAFCGIGTPERFKASLAEAGREPGAFRVFPDHHVFTARELGSLREEAGAHGAALVTTEKDFVRLARGDKEGITPLGGSMVSDDLPAMLAMIEEQL
jgi:tetraacyldisaccharide 4'-kinase